MKTKDIIDEFEKCMIDKRNEEAIPYVEVYKHLDNLMVTFNVEKRQTGPNIEIRRVDIRISGELPLTKAMKRVMDERKKVANSKPKDPRATMGEP